MLLLVLILVLVAFGLLLVGLLSGSVMWAWVSVAVSLAAFGALVADWVSRRSAVKAGDESGGDDASGVDGRPDPSSAEGSTAAAGYPDIEPVTQVIPVVRPSGHGPAQGSHGGRDAPMRPGMPVDRGTDPPHDPDADSQQTVMMPVVGPSGSPAGPSGATGASTPSSESSSPSVAETWSDQSPPLFGEDFAAERSTDRPAEMSPPVERPADNPTVVVAAPGSDGSATGGPETTGDPATVSAPDGSDGSALPGSALPGSATAAGSGSGADPSDGPAKSGSAHDGPGDEAGGPAADRSPGGAFADGPAGAAAGSDGEPPQERPDAAVAEVVSGLDDEVLVVDEQPRYHVPGCRSLLAASLIPLPAREAVELGFTPCGWCTPDRTLAGRHPAAAR